MFLKYYWYNRSFTEKRPQETDRLITVFRVKEEYKGMLRHATGLKIYTHRL